MRLSPYLLLLILLSSCSSDRTPDLQSSFSVADDTGRRISLPHAPKRIVSLSPHVTEILFALELDSAVVGVTDYCDYPPEARALPRVGGLASPNFEKLIELDPDIVIMTVSGNTRQDFESLRRLKFNVFVTDPRSLDGVFESIRRIALLTGHEAAGNSLATLLKRRSDSLTAVAATRRKIPTLFLLSLQPIISTGSGTFIDELIQRAGGINIAAKSPIAYPLLSKEEILRNAPEVIIVSSDVAEAPEDIARSLKELSDIPAIAHKRIRIIDADLVSRPGPRIVNGLADMIRALHPSQGGHR